MKKKYFDFVHPCQSIPYSFKWELTGYIDENNIIHYKNGTKINCSSFSEEKTVFHTHLDVLPGCRTMTLPDMPSPMDILVFAVADNQKMYIKTTRIFITLEKTKETKAITNKIVKCLMENEIHWKHMVKKKQNERMFFFLLHYLRKGLDRKNSVWNLSWKRLTEQIFKIKVNIETSTVKDHL